MRVVSHLAFACVAACALAACGVTNPADLKSETFSGSLDPGGSFTAPASIFRTSKTGEFTAKMTALAPDSGTTFSALVGVPTTAGGVQGCGVNYSAIAGLNRTFFDQQLPTGDWCFQLTDPTGSLPRTQTFTIVISHL